MRTTAHQTLEEYKVFYDKTIEGRSFKDIAREYKISSTSVRNKVHRYLQLSSLVDGFPKLSKRVPSRVLAILARNKIYNEKHLKKAGFYKVRKFNNLGAVYAALLKDYFDSED